MISMGIRLQVKNFRVLRNVDWSPDGVCLVVGPNGAGKTTLFDAMSFLTMATKADLGQAVAALGGTYFRNLDAPIEEPVSFGLTQGDCTWRLSIANSAGPFNLSLGDHLAEGPETLFLKRQGEHIASFRDQKFPWN